MSMVTDTRPDRRRGKDYAPEVVVYSGPSIRGKGTFGTELARFGVNSPGTESASPRADRWNDCDNIIVGSGPRLERVKVYQIPLASSRVTDRFYSRPSSVWRKPSRREHYHGFVDFSTGRSIVTAPGPGSPAEVAYSPSRFCSPSQWPIQSWDQSWRQDRSCGVRATDKPVKQPHLPVAGLSGRCFAGDRMVAGSLGGAKRIVVSQLADRGSVKVFSSGSAWMEGRTVSAEPSAPRHGANFARSRASSPLKDRRTRVATTSKRLALICWSAELRLGLKMRASSNTIFQG